MSTSTPAAPEAALTVPQPARPRVLFVSTIEALWGGSEVLWSEAAMAAAGAGWSVAAWFPYYKDVPPIRRLAAAGVRLFYGTPPPLRWWRRVTRPALNRLQRFQRALDAFAPALVVINQGGVRDALPEMAECRHRNLSHAILNQSVEPLLYPDKVWAQLREAFAGVRHLWCVSAENLEHLRSYLALPLNQAEVITNAYACPFEVKCPWPAASTPVRLAVVSRLNPLQKGQDLLLDVMALPQWRARELHLTIFGEGDSYDLLEARRARLELEKVTITGRPAALAEIWDRHHGLVLPSRFEGQALAMIEAMLYARPVIATPVGGTAGVVIDGVTGFLAEHVDASAFDHAMEHAWRRREEWRQIGENAANHIRQKVSPSPGRDFLGKLGRLINQPAP
jgi:glycosyltransferase involved in cell wall biosynthesis